jgi:hypothetical protein
MPRSNKENAPIGEHLDQYLAIELDSGCRHPTTQNTTNVEQKLLQQIQCICDRCDSGVQKLKLTFIDLKNAIIESHETITRAIEHMSETPTEEIIKRLAIEIMRIFTDLTKETCIRHWDRGHSYI